VKLWKEVRNVYLGNVLVRWRGEKPVFEYCFLWCMEKLMPVVLVLLRKARFAY